ncbi:flagellar biosynthetic protein FliO [Nitrosovibrio tenuis]|nr:flagellar biosynthetic protein FliO [Nitrosovibrio tenuis]
MRCSISFLLIGYGVLASNARAAASVDTGGAVSDGGMLQVMLGLGLVLALMAGLAWLLRRFTGMQRGTAGAIRVIGGSAVGQRERVVLVEIADTWLVIGVAPGHVSALHSMPKGEGTVSIAGQTGNDARFPAWFRQVMEKRHDECKGEQQRAE